MKAAIIVSKDHMTEFLERPFTNLRNQNGDEYCVLIREMIVQTCQGHIGRRYANSGKRDSFLGPTAIASHIGNSEVSDAALEAV